MIIGTIALLSMLFGSEQYFLLDKIEKSVKKMEIEKERKNELLTDLKDSEKFIKEFYKLRKGKFKELRGMYASRNTSETEFESFFNMRSAERADFQQTAISRRIQVADKFTQEEWDKIIELSAENVLAVQEKAGKKKVKDPISSIVNTINKTISEEAKASKAISVLKDFELQLNALAEQISSMNALDDNVINKKNSTFEEIEERANAGNVLRKKLFQEISIFHFEMKTLTTQKEWDKIMKEFNTLLE